MKVIFITSQQIVILILKAHMTIEDALSFTGQSSPLWGQKTIVVVNLQVT
jgi:hypothetical protein